MDQDQARIGMLTEAIEDRQWIHVDRERAGYESPYGRTVARGFLTLALLTLLLPSAVRLLMFRMGINHGLNRRRFPTLSMPDQKIRAHFTLESFEELLDGAQPAWNIVIERGASDKPYCIVERVTEGLNRDTEVVRCGLFLNIVKSQSLRCMQAMLSRSYNY